MSGTHNLTTPLSMPVWDGRVVDATVSISAGASSTLSPTTSAKWAVLSVLGTGSDKLWVSVSSRVGTTGAAFGGTDHRPLVLRIDDITSGGINVINQESGTVVCGVLYFFE